MSNITRFQLFYCVVGSVGWSVYTSGTQISRTSSVHSYLRSIFTVHPREHPVPAIYAFSFLFYRFIFRCSRDLVHFRFINFIFSLFSLFYLFSLFSLFSLLITAYLSISLSQPRPIPVMYSLIYGI